MSPLTHFRCPGNPFAWKTIDGCRSCKDRCLPIELINVIWRTQFPQHGENVDHYHNTKNFPKVLSVSEAMWEGGCLRQSWFKRKRDYAEEPESFLARLQGGQFHWAVDWYNTDPDDGGDDIEVELSLDLGGGWTLKGTADILNDEIVADWKTMPAARKTHSSRDIEQLSVYNQMAGGGRKLFVYQVGRKTFASHEVAEDEDALGNLTIRAKMLAEALDLPGDDKWALPPEGREKHFKFDSKTICHYCQFAAECGEID